MLSLAAVAVALWLVADDQRRDGGLVWQLDPCDPYLLSAALSSTIFAVGSSLAWLVAIVTHDRAKREGGYR